MQYRFEEVCKATAKLMQEGLTVFSPISQNHVIKQLADLPPSWDFWEKYDTNFLSVSNALYVLQLEGWEKSIGVNAEIKLAKEQGIPIYYILPE